MSHQVEHETGPVLDLERPLEPPPAPPRRHRPEPPMGAHANGHSARSSETEPEREAVAVPFVRSGLERGERVVGAVGGADRMRAIVDDHGGEIRVESDPSQGSPFVVMLPKRPSD